MLKKSDIISISGVGIKLFLITAISALVLAVINYVTAPIIEANNVEKQNVSMQKVLPLAKTFEKTDISALATVDFPSEVTAVYKGIDDNDDVLGFAVMVSSGGYGGDISLVVGVDNELKVTGVDIVSHSETPGLGAKCKTDDFRNQFIGKTIDIKVTKNGAKDNEIDAITSATITSNAVTNGVNSAIGAINLIKEAE